MRVADSARLRRRAERQRLYAARMEAAGVQLQVSALVGHKIRVVPCTSLAGDEVPIGTAEFSGHGAEAADGGAGSA